MICALSSTNMCTLQLLACLPADGDVSYRGGELCSAWGMPGTAPWAALLQRRQPRSCGRGGSPEAVTGPDPTVSRHPITWLHLNVLC